ncbi:hypothetical protein CC78DRAFT_53458 [Lojkania enalia]|uniref:Uncharacterized protein n=1 Tax=Lojkania enalia TaxID=147567 RepID=A0A9P4K0A5_9PLEO|nr:hypothetical protein CC78DRAFT_53458 [Didymosphaeria enalia]
MENSNHCCINTSNDDDSQKSSVTSIVPRLFDLPGEILINILEQAIGPFTRPEQHLQTRNREGKPHAESLVTFSSYNCLDENGNDVIFTHLAASKDPFIKHHLSALLHRSWKLFYRIEDFYYVHASTYRTNTYTTPAPAHISTRPGTPVAPLQTTSYHGLTKIHLDMPMEHYFALFRVTVPPFSSTYWTETSNLHFSLGAGSLLVHTQRLVLDFSDRYDRDNFWYSIDVLVWEDPEPTWRSNTCLRGVVVDWILSYAWHYGLLQHIGTIELEGEIQMWVREKWEGIFGRHGAEAFVVGREDIESIETRGLESASQSEVPWNRIEHYPPTCICKVPCETLVGRNLLIEEGWDTGLEGGVASPVGSWYLAAGVEEPCYAGFWD